MPKCLKCNKVEVAADALYCDSCKPIGKQDDLKTRIHHLLEQNLVSMLSLGNSYAENCSDGIF
jgi:hypothetical protein